MGYTLRNAKLKNLLTFVKRDDLENKREFHTLQCSDMVTSESNILLRILKNSKLKTCNDIYSPYFHIY